MAGDRLPLELLVPGYSPEPYVSGSDLRDELRKLIKPKSSIS